MARKVNQLSTLSHGKKVLRVHAWLSILADSTSNFLSLLDNDFLYKKLCLFGFLSCFVFLFPFFLEMCHVWCEWLVHVMKLLT